MNRFPTDRCFLLLGGGGMIGQQIAHEIARELEPEEIVICALTQNEVDRAVSNFEREFPKGEFPKINISGEAGDVFLRSEWNPIARGDNPLSRTQLLKSEEYRESLYEDIFQRLDEGPYERSELVRLIHKYKPDVIIDSVNTATAISYQDVHTASDLAKKQFDVLEAAYKGLAGGERTDKEQGKANVELGELLGSAGCALETVLISQSLPQLVRHVLLINKAMRDVNTRLYLKIGTTGTGGMGLNIPYTHSEDSPSATLMEKTAIAFAHTGLMYLMARTLGGPAVKELKPAAMVGYADISYQPVRAGAKGKIGVPGQFVKLYEKRIETLSNSGSLRLHPTNGTETEYQEIGEMSLALVNTGENGLFTKGEFQAITSMRQMEFITPEEIARQAVLEIKGSNTGYDVIAAIDGASMNPTYRAGYLRHFAIDELEKLEGEHKAPSVALGELGPPELGKLLWEAYLLKVLYEKGGIDRMLENSAEQMADEVFAHLQEEARLSNTIVSVGFPILAPDGQTLIRGPYIRIPEKPNEDFAKFDRWEDVEEWAGKGWVDLRPQNMERWQQRFNKMRHETGRIRERGSAAFTREAYVSEKIRIGVVVGWIFNNEENFGYRIK
jgi:hypothetical protein